MFSIIRSVPEAGIKTRPGLLSLRQAPLRVAVIDRDGAFLRALAERTDALGWTLIVHHGPVTGHALQTARPHAVLVDTSLLGPRWDDWLARHLVRVPDFGVAVCTERSTVHQRVRGLHLGVDDWITKPCHVDEVVARLQAIVRARRRASASRDRKPLRRGVLELNPAIQDAFVAGRKARLTRREFEICLYLAHRAGRVVERERLYAEVWGCEMACGSRSVDTLVRKIRNKLGRVSPGWRYIHTHKGVGYRFAIQRATGVKSRSHAGG
jgi:DNA-binding response OmpR family regulator